MPNPKYSIDGEWPEFSSDFELITWLGEQQDIKAGRFSDHTVSRTYPLNEKSQDESVSNVLP
jgi:hypothetical protein